MGRERQIMGKCDFRMRVIFINVNKCKLVLSVSALLSVGLRLITLKYIEYLHGNNKIVNIEIETAHF